MEFSLSNGIFWSRLRYCLDRGCIMHTYIIMTTRIKEQDVTSLAHAITSFILLNGFLLCTLLASY